MLYDDAIFGRKQLEKEAFSIVTILFYYIDIITDDEQSQLQYQSDDSLYKPRELKHPVIASNFKHLIILEVSRGNRYSYLYAGAVDVQYED